MDVAKLSDEQKENLIEHLARQFKDEIKKSDNYHQKNPESYVRENLNQIGVPILADNCYAYMSGSMLF